MTVSLAQPKSVPTDDELREFIETLRNQWIRTVTSGGKDPDSDDFDRAIARAVLARWGHPTPPAPKPRWVGELAAFLNQAEWKWEGNKLTDLPRAAWCDFRRTIRGPILKILIGDDLVIVGDIYLNNETKGTALIQISNGKWGEVIGSTITHDGPTAIVPSGCDPR